MTDYHTVEPEVAGGWGANTAFTRMPGQSVVVHKLHYEFEGWLGDDLIESTPCYIVSEGMAEQLRKAGLTGFVLDDVEITTSENFRETYAGRELPKFLWLKVGGVPGQDDLGIAHALVGAFAG